MGDSVSFAMSWGADPWVDTGLKYSDRSKIRHTRICGRASAFKESQRRQRVSHFRLFHLLHEGIKWIERCCGRKNCPCLLTANM
jgi:hypothetical protein